MSANVNEIKIPCSRITALAVYGDGVAYDVEVVLLVCGTVITINDVTISEDKHSVVKDGKIYYHHKDHNVLMDNEKHHLPLSRLNRRREREKNKS